MAGPRARAESVRPADRLDRPPKQFPKLRQASLLHKYQLGIAVLPGVGFRGIFPYQENVNCGQQAKRVCTGLLPFFLDVQPSFGFAEHWDVLVDLRFGIATDFTTALSSRSLPASATGSTRSCRSSSTPPSRGCSTRPPSTTR